MNFGGFLVGVAVSAFAAFDAIAAEPSVMAEPDPAEHVRICDEFGNHFFYIPGAETCLRISGYVR